VLVFLLLQPGFSLAVRAATGLEPYAHYGVLLETLVADEAASYQRGYPGWLAWLLASRDRVTTALGWNAVMVARNLFTLPNYHFVGWLALPALAHAFVRRGRGAFAGRVAALSALGFAAVLLGSWGALEPRRLTLFTAVCLWVVAIPLLVDVAGWLAALPSARGAERLAAALRWLPVALVLALFLGTRSAPDMTRWALAHWRAYRAAGTAQPSGPWDETARRFCPELERDALVASPDPWAIYLWCGNAGMVIPRDLDSPAWLARYLEAESPGYLVSDGTPALRLLGSAPQLERVATRGHHVLYRVKAPSPASRPWHAPPPLSEWGR
jgi:hypothetical protein